MDPTPGTRGAAHHHLLTPHQRPLAQLDSLAELAACANELEPEVQADVTEAILGSIYQIRHAGSLIEASLVEGHLDVAAADFRELVQMLRRNQIALDSLIRSILPPHEH